MSAESAIPERSPAQLVAENLRRVRELKGISAADLARALGWSRPLLSRKERGESGVSIDQMIEAALVLGVPLVELLRPGIAAAGASDEPLVPVNVDRAARRPDASGDRLIGPDEFLEAVFGFPAERLTTDQLGHVREFLIRIRFEEWVLSQHPLVDQRIAPNRRDQQRAAAIASVVGVRLGTSGVTVAGEVGRDAAAKLASVHGLDDADWSEVSSADAWRDVVNCRRRLREERAAGVDEIRRLIRRGHLPAPEIPDDLDVRDVQGPFVNRAMTAVADAWLDAVRRYTEEE